jgi:hypothetical protein
MNRGDLGGSAAAIQADARLQRANDVPGIPGRRPGSAGGIVVALLTLVARAGGSRTMKKESEEMLRKERELAERAAEQGDTGRPGGGKGRTDRPIPADLPEGALDPVSEGSPGYRDSGDSEVIPPDRLTGQNHQDRNRPPS